MTGGTVDCVPLRRWALLSLAALVLFFGLQGASGTPQGEIMGHWAEKLGRELWELGQNITKAPDIIARYKALHVRVEHKDGHSLLKSAVETVGRMLARKMEAIKCIQDMAEKSAEEYEFNITDTNLTYYSAKYSMVEDKDAPAVPETLKNDSWLYLNMTFNVDTHFYNISVNTEYSSVHVPTNVYDRGQEVLSTIAWSASLDDVFVRNYNSDPGLSWQYLCSSTGIMRQYPAIAWPTAEPDVFDCRTRSWFIEAATCSKDVIILFDNSGSMTGNRNFIAKFTVKSILETFSNNDFLNIFTFSNDTFDSVECFEDKLVQATPDNLRTFNEALAKLKPDGHANFTLAFIRAFELLEEYRINRGCKVNYVGCNQVIMLVTDGVPGNLTNVFDTYNLQNNGTHIPVRIFTYLIGKEVTNVREIQWMACLHRGYYVHIRSLDEVREKVLKYISVIARPLVLQGEDHPISWTHAYVDITPSEEKSGKSKGRVNYRLMTSAAIPLYDTKTNKKNDTRTAYLLGVAGTDVPVEDIDKLTLPYKLGVNGYSFIVSNNGYLLLHPDLRPVYKGILKENYNSVDVVEVETIDDELGIRKLGHIIRNLRRALVEKDEGSMLGVEVRFHYDDMRRVSREKQDYYYALLPNTPFSLGIVLPHNYGSTWIKVGDEVRRNQHLGLKVEDFFQGDNWKVHPNWVYCKYHYLEGHEFTTPEQELLHFLEKMGQPDWKWSEQYEPEMDSPDDSDQEFNCSRKSLGDNDYYCNRELVQLLVFDAKVTEPSYTTWSFQSDEEEQLFLRYNASLRFAATMSGLTRWQFVFGEDMNDTSSEFGDDHTKAIDETWYKSAILQYLVDSESFVFSVPFDVGAQEPQDTLVTASRALFPRDGGKHAPAAVLGFQFSHQALQRRFFEITSELITKCEECMPCDSDEKDCYVLDSSGYVLVSEDYNNTGRFFGELDGAVMEAMVKKNIFQRVSVFDLQGICFESIMVNSPGNILATPLQWVSTILRWFCGQLGWLLLQANLSFLFLPLGVCTQPMEDDDAEYYDGYDSTGDDRLRGTPPPRKMRKGLNLEEEEYFNRPRLPKWEERSFPCDRQADLYVLQQREFIYGDGFMYDDTGNQSRPYYVKRIPSSNLILVVVDSMHPSPYMQLQAGARPLSSGPDPNTPCYKLELATLPRRPLKGCYTDHNLEDEIEECGEAAALHFPLFLLLFCWFLLLAKRLII